MKKTKILRWATRKTATTQADATSVCLLYTSSDEGIEYDDEDDEDDDTEEDVNVN